MLASRIAKINSLHHDCRDPEHIDTMGYRADVYICKDDEVIKKYYAEDGGNYECEEDCQAYLKEQMLKDGYTEEFIDKLFDEGECEGNNGETIQYSAEEYDWLPDALELEEYERYEHD